MTWLVRREYTRVELARRLLQKVRQSHRQAGQQQRAAEDVTRQEEALADEFAPPPPRSGLAHPAGDALAPTEMTADDADPPQFDGAAARAAIDRLLERLAAQGLLSDERAAEAIVDARKSRRGVRRIAQELAQKGVAPEQAQMALAEVRTQQVPLAQVVWARRFGSLPRDLAERQKQTRFLASRGFDFDVIRAVLGGSVADEEAPADGMDGGDDWLA